jgi:diacylglycerol kinase (ATP)
MVALDRVVVVFNPNSSGESEALARQLVGDLAREAPGLEVDLVATEHAGHARDIARDAAGTGRVLVVSVSGDGGYNEVVEGVLAAANPDALSGVLAAGNANDHARVTQDRPLLDLILTGTVRRLDLLAVTMVPPSGEEPEVRHAHSYVGVGLTPAVAVDLEKGGKGSLGEVATVVRSFARFTPHHIVVEGARVRVASLLFANIDEMAKVATLSDDAAPDDGRFEIILLRYRSKAHVLATALRAATWGLGVQPSARRYTFRAVDAMPLQLDGELVELAPGTEVTVEIRPGAHATLG